MAVSTYRRKQGKLEVIVKARAFFERIATAALNENKFPKMYYDVITKELVEKAKGVYMNCWRANSILVKTREDYEKRKALQGEALLDASDFLALLSSAVEIFHIPKRRAMFWTTELMDVMNLIRAWKKSDGDRYAKI